MKATAEQIEEIIDSIGGTCFTDEDGQIEDCLGVDDVNDVENYDDIFQQIEENVFRCGRCGWWCDRGEEHEIEDEESCCDDCLTENEEEWASYIEYTTFQRPYATATQETNKVFQINFGRSGSR